MKYKIVPVRSDFLDKVRNVGIDDQNQPVEVLEAKGGEPCRDVLRGAKAGEKLILASYCPFTKTGPYKEYGPIFVLANSNSQEFDVNKLPLPNGSATDYLGHTFVLKAYCENERILDAKLTSPEHAETDLEGFLTNKKVSFVIARYAAYGCYSFRVERV
ncbi:DUF1203 domain-containing protein [Pseudoalteromonas sp. McH1-7]|uniref:DUF1203 domain-containing protein n=1 Tax=unclassified Pseudoalteromonas TaxID=194690 RepID=UPI001590C53F|nr:MULTISPECIES: DUF1203 domain-containing protein [unclassified Pseudoalteromonas]NUZ11021.1 DUF1203 domain-containing protein [Pseudoalteromonas sp. McH1-7]USD27416.1 DUF1203 domain-containing protein [Pseudoalteromonas sp. SCSIO 43201]